MGGVDDQHGMELEADRPGLNAAHAGKKKCGQELLITQPRSHAARDGLDQLVAMGVFDELDERLDVGV